MGIHRFLKPSVCGPRYSVLLFQTICNFDAFACVWGIVSAGRSKGSDVLDRAVCGSTGRRPAMSYKAGMLERVHLWALLRWIDYIPASPPVIVCLCIFTIYVCTCSWYQYRTSIQDRHDATDNFHLLRMMFVWRVHRRRQGSNMSLETCTGVTFKKNLVIIKEMIWLLSPGIDTPPVWFKPCLHCVYVVRFWKPL